MRSGRRVQRPPNDHLCAARPSSVLQITAKLHFFQPPKTADWHAMGNTDSFIYKAACNIFSDKFGGMQGGMTRTENITMFHTRFSYPGLTMGCNVEL